MMTVSLSEVTVPGVSTYMYVMPSGGLTVTVAVNWPLSEVAIGV